MNSGQENRLQRYVQSNTLKIVGQIGFGIHGAVFHLLREKFVGTAAKVFEDEFAYEREKAVYFRLGESNVVRIEEFHVPELINHDDELLILEMTLVPRPFVLDFASAYLDELPPYFPPFGPEWWAEKEAQFGEGDFEKVRAVLAELEALGIFQTDVSPSNIAVRELPQPTD